MTTKKEKEPIKITPRYGIKWECKTPEEKAIEVENMVIKYGPKILNEGTFDSGTFVAPPQKESIKDEGYTLIDFTADLNSHWEEVVHYFDTIEEVEDWITGEEMGDVDGILLFEGHFEPLKIKLKPAKVKLVIEENNNG